MADKELRKDYKKVEDITSENCPSDVQAACKGFYSEQTISAVEIIEKARSQDSSTPSKSKEMSDSILACFIFEVGGSYMPVGGLSAKLGLGNETKRNETSAIWGYHRNVENYIQSAGVTWNQETVGATFEATWANKETKVLDPHLVWKIRFIS